MPLQCHSTKPTPPAPPAGGAQRTAASTTARAPTCRSCATARRRGAANSPRQRSAAARRSTSIKRSFQRLLAACARTHACMHPTRMRATARASGLRTRRDPQHAHRSDQLQRKVEREPVDHPLAGCLRQAAERGVALEVAAHRAYAQLLRRRQARAQRVSISGRAGRAAARARVSSEAARRVTGALCVNTLGT